VILCIECLPKIPGLVMFDVYGMPRLQAFIS